MKRTATVIALLLCASAIVAGVSATSYKDWAKSPVAYYMTNDERKQWDALQSDVEREQFIKDFIARRGGETFTKEVAQNAAQADKYLTVGKTAGSESLRGKMMILLGPAAPSAVTKKKKAGEVRMAPSTIGMSGIDAGPSLQDMQTAANDPGNSTYYITEYTYTYPATALPAAYGKPLTIKFEVEPDKDRDRLVGVGAAKELDKLYEMAAQAKLAAAKAAAPQP
jgi:GWxTD domain-containing protein